MRAFWKHEQFAVRCPVFTATHSANKAHRVDAETQTEVRIQQRTVEQIVHYPMQQVVTQERDSERIAEQTVDAPVPHVMEGIVESEYVAYVAYTAPATVIEYVASSLVVTCAAPAPVIEYVASLCSPALDAADQQLYDLAILSTKPRGIIAWP